MTNTLPGENPLSMMHRPILISTRCLSLSPSFYFHFVSTLRDRLNLRLADPKVDDFPFSIQFGRIRGMVVGEGPHKQKTLSVTRNLVV